MIKLLLILVIIFPTLTMADNNKLGYYNDFIFQNKQYNSSEKFIEYSHQYESKDSYGFKIGEVNSYTKTGILQFKDNYVELDQVLIQSKKTYWQNAFYISNNNVFLPQYKLDINRFQVFNKEELGLGMYYSEYRLASIFSPNVQGTLYLNNGDYLNLKFTLTYYQHFYPTLSFYYNYILNQYIEIKPYVSSGYSMEDIGISDSYKTIGLKVKINLGKSSLEFFGESYSGQLYRQEKKVGAYISIGF